MQSDNGTEFNCLIYNFVTTGVLFQTSCVGTQQQHGRVERKHKHILNVGRVLRFQAKLPIYFWGECVMAATHLINHTLTPMLQNKTPLKFYSTNHLRLMLFVFFGACVLHIIRKQTEVNFLVEVENVYFRGIRLERKDGSCMILK